VLAVLDKSSGPTCKPFSSDKQNVRLPPHVQLYIMAADFDPGLGMWISYAILGFLVGNITGLSASPIASVLIPSLFTLGGGSLIGLFSKLDKSHRDLTARCLAAFGLACLAGLYGGILINSHHVLGSPPFAVVQAAEPAGDAGNKSADIVTGNSYLRGQSGNEVQVVRQLVDSGKLSPQEGCALLMRKADGAR